MDNTTRLGDGPIRRRLDERARALEAEIAAVRGTAPGEVGHEVADLKDGADERQQEAVGDAGLERDLAELRAILRARQHLDEGRYGLCEDCGEPIAAARLAAQPAALRCLGCQAAAEQRRTATP